MRGASAAERAKEEREDSLPSDASDDGVREVRRLLGPGEGGLFRYTRGVGSSYRLALLARGQRRLIVQILTS